MIRANKPTEKIKVRGTRWVAESEIERVEEREQGVKSGEAGVKNGKSKRNLKLSLRGSVETIRGLRS